jgi:hypothetical protein
MANQPRPDNPARGIRVEDSLWNAAIEIATEQDETISQVVRRALRKYVADAERRRQRAAAK